MTADLTSFFLLRRRLLHADGTGWAGMARVLAGLGEAWQGVAEPPGEDAFRAWIADALPYSDTPHVVVEVDWAYSHGDDAGALWMGLRAPERLAARHTDSALSDWMRGLPGTPRWANEAALLAVLARWCRRADPDTLIGADHERMFAVYGFDWQGEEAILHIGDVDACGWAPLRID